MVKSKSRAGLTVVALCGMVSANPASALGATRSAAALPLLAASVGSVPYSNGIETSWRCVRVTDEALKLKKKYVQVDAAGRVVVDPKGASFPCKAPVTAYKAGGGGFPFEALLGILGAAGLALGLSGGGGNDSTG
ncbi:MAG: hypothetical protein H6R45_858 [Proteobacteria bacterium]|nr:hypothetical protein [Pseudomonadota bacterium]